MLLRLLLLLYVVLHVAFSNAQPKVLIGAPWNAQKQNDDSIYFLETPDSIAFNGLSLDRSKIYDYEVLGIATARNKKTLLSFGPHVYHRNLFTGFLLFNYEKLDSFESELTISTNIPIKEGVFDPEKLNEMGNGLYFIVNVNKIRDDVGYATYKLDYSKSPNFLRVVSYDKNTKILKARFRFSFVLDTKNTSEYLVDKFIWDDGILYTKIID